MNSWSYEENRNNLNVILDFIASLICSIDEIPHVSIDRIHSRAQGNWSSFLIDFT